MEILQSPPLSDKIESVFVLGGARAYEVSSHRAMRSSPKVHDRTGTNRRPV